MVVRLPNVIDPLLLADRNAKIEGELPLSGFQRLAEILYDQTGNISIQLQFAKKGKLPTVEGHLLARLNLKCQRCLEALEWGLNSHFKLGVIVSIAQADNLPGDHEPLLLGTDETTLLADLIEDEILLVLPDIPKHQNDCTATTMLYKPDKSLPPVEHSPKPNPFSILADLKHQETPNGSTKE